MDKTFNGNMGVAAQGLDSVRNNLKELWESGEVRLLPAEVKSLGEGIDKLHETIKEIEILLESFEEIALKQNETTTSGDAE